MGVTSSMTFTLMPAVCRAVIALSRPEPGPFTRTSNSFTPYLEAFSAACCPAHWPANGVLLRLPLKPQVPALAQHRASPFVSVIVTTVLLNVAFTWAIATVTLRRTFFFLLDAAAVVAIARYQVPDNFKTRSTKLEIRNKFECSKCLMFQTTWQSSLLNLILEICFVLRTSLSTFPYRRSLTPFLPATVFFGPFRVRAFV